MRLKRLELQGFKSFLDRTILSFDPGITGVVGPNGCGKSNIVDAIQWVMGEQSAKHLRGESMTDVIFNGSDGKAPTSMAEVSLVLDRQNVPLSSQFSAFEKADEISITRRVYRDGTGEFLINKTACRLKDIHELFMDTGVGRRAYSIIEQGQIDRMINVKPDERRYLFEEVAGITKYKIKRKEAERKLDLTRQNMVRLADITAELEKQIRSLKVQATRAKKYKELKSELEAVDLYLLGRNLYQHRRNLGDLEARRAELVSSRSESDATFAEADAELTQLEVLRLDQERAIQDLSGRERDLSLLVQKLESQLSLLEERRRHLSESEAASHQEEKEIAESLVELTEEGQSAESERDAMADELERLEADISRRETEIRDQQDQRFRANQRRDSLSGKRNQLSNRRVMLENQQQNGQSKERDLLERRAELETRQTELTVTREAFEASLREADQKMESVAERTSQASNEARSLHSECQQTSAELSKLEETLFSRRETFHQKRSRLESLQELQENLEGYSPSAREILGQLEGSGVEAVPMAEVLSPEADIEDHLELLLGAEMNTLLVKTTEQAENLARMIHSRDLERVRILALSDISNREPVELGSEAAPLLSKIRVTPGYESAAQWWLGNAFLAGEIDSVLALRAKFPSATLLSNDAKTIASHDRSLTSGNLPTRVGVFARKREIDELVQLCSRLEVELKSLGETRERLLEQLQTQERMHSELKDKLSSLHIENVEYRKEREKIQFEQNRASRDSNALANDLARNQQQLDDLKSQFAKWQTDLETLSVEEEQLATEFDAAQEAIATASSSLDGMTEAINEGKVEKSRLGEKLNSLEYKIEKSQSEVELLTSRREALLNQRVRDQRELENIDGNRLEITSQQTVNSEERNQVMVRISDLKLAFGETCSRLQELKLQQGDLLKKRERLGQEITEVELKLQQEISTLEHLKGLSMERYGTEAVSHDDSLGVDLEKLPLLASDVENWETLAQEDKMLLLEEHLKNLKEKVSRYGEVNLTAIQEFEEIQKRYDFLIEQKTDLEKSIGILEEAIQKIDESTKTRFEETFEAVNSKFREIFPILFNGGKAELALTQAENVLESGVDIMVHPPGKRPASITLLSGGEKALTAVSLILAIFARKPSPFCLLDEVDAPLDDANVSRFNTVIRKMAEKTQFIVITHNKKTMEIAEALYGVTMERPGISKMTSVRLN